MYNCENGVFVTKQYIGMRSVCDFTYDFARVLLLTQKQAHLGLRVYVFPETLDPKP